MSNRPAFVWKIAGLCILLTALVWLVFGQYLAALADRLFASKPRFLARIWENKRPGPSRDPAVEFQSLRTG